ncbi:TetR/AcrR family transcriptional regulator [Actinomycetospora sp. TBRC 11914]|uniref:TetR/AcrR family transcriptional regulator n=1 Tax=Actinomycetospora sp. TBRC 11914 TaxID=2729387 RepID=UPI00145F6382|nr:TetR/AcrR family transcriptional regulator [Actinomycetospora sp. TBRC 11914]NMO93824.1 TetR/AcrR family transcriptional regulator [Actinomycetospora sp. TBRC 11914]
MGRVQRKRDERVRRIVATAADVLGERGYEATNLEDVAARLDLTKGSLYYYFAGKDELATAAVETLGNDWTARLEEMPATGTCAERLRALLREHIAIAVREYPAALRLFLVPNSWPEGLRARIRELRRRHDQVFRRVVREGVEAGEFAVVDEDATLQAMHAAMSQAPVWCSQLAGEAQDRAMDDLADVLMKLCALPRS